ncbi:MAG TPA: hypothetical protein VMV02_01555 [Acidimicrobiales bacterium]|nr:hypothetical protein [Acidimicrobiales bacterium]
MGVMDRISTMLEAKAHAVPGQVGEPREAIEHACELEHDELRRVRRAAAVEHERLALELVNLDESVVALDAQARDAVALGREDLARDALALLRAVALRIAPVAAERDRLAAERDRLAAGEGRLAAVFAPASPSAERPSGARLRADPGTR